MNTNLKKIILTSLLAALTCAATMIIRIPTPGTSGYIHPGDALVILSGVILGPVYGLFAAGIGSAMADLLGGYFIYVPITFVIKASIACVSGFIFKKLGSNAKNRSTAVILCGIVDIVFVSGGYFLCESVLYGAAASIVSIPANAIQGISGLVIATVLYPLLFAIPDVRKVALEFAHTHH